MMKWESEKHKSWVMPAESFRSHATTDGSLQGKAESGEPVVEQWYSWIMMKR